MFWNRPRLLYGGLPRSQPAEVRPSSFLCYVPTQTAYHHIVRILESTSDTINVLGGVDLPWAWQFIQGTVDTFAKKRTCSAQERGRVSNAQSHILIKNLTFCNYFGRENDQGRWLDLIQNASTCTAFPGIDSSRESIQTEQTRRSEEFCSWSRPFWCRLPRQLTRRTLSTMSFTQRLWRNLTWRKNKHATWLESLSVVWRSGANTSDAAWELKWEVSTV